MPRSANIAFCFENQLEEDRIWVYRIWNRTSPSDAELLCQADEPLKATTSKTVHTMQSCYCMRHFSDSVRYWNELLTSTTNSTFLKHISGIGRHNNLTTLLFSFSVIETLLRWTFKPYDAKLSLPIFLKPARSTNWSYEMRIPSKT